MNSEFLAPPPGLVLLATGTHPKASGGLTRSLLIRTKGAPMIRDVPRGLGTLDQEPGAETKFVFLPTFAYHETL